MKRMQSASSIFFLLFCLFLSSCTSQRIIVNALTEREANEILVYLDTKGIKATKVKAEDSGAAGGGDRGTFWNISVPEEQGTRAMALLNQAGLPRQRGQSLLGIFKNTGLVPSELQEKVRYQQGLAEQIASTIRRMDGILDADVNISFPEEDPLNPEANSKKKITASVYVKHAGVLDDPNSHLITKIKRYVTSSVTGLNYDDVTVVPDRARFIATPGLSQRMGEPDKEFVRVWTLTIGTDSLTRFQIIFFAFIFLLLLLFLAIIWIFWKIYPVLQERGGASKLFTLQPLTEEKEENLSEDKEQDESDEERKDKSVEEPKDEKTKPAREKPQMEPGPIEDEDVER